jgi:hypothetical protein
MVLRDRLVAIPLVRPGVRMLSRLIARGDRSA